MEEHSQVAIQEVSDKEEAEGEFGGALFSSGISALAVPGHQWQSLQDLEYSGFDPQDQILY